MGKVTFQVDPSLQTDFPQARIFALRVELADQSHLLPVLENLAPALDAAGEALQAVEPITALPEIARWREAYAKLGVKPSKFHSSVESLLRRAKKGQMAQIGIPVVDIYNAASVLHHAPLGAYDVGKLAPPPISLRHAVPGVDTFDPLGGRAEDFPLNPDLVVYAQGTDVLCWGFNTRDSQKTCVDEGSTDIAFFSECGAQDGYETAQAALTALQGWFREAGAKTSGIQSAGHSEGAVNLDLAD